MKFPKFKAALDPPSSNETPGTPPVPAALTTPATPVADVSQSAPKDVPSLSPALPSASVAAVTEQSSEPALAITQLDGTIPFHGVPPPPPPHPPLPGKPETTGAPTKKNFFQRLAKNIRKPTSDGVSVNPVLSVAPDVSASHEAPIAIPYTDVDTANVEVDEQEAERHKQKYFNVLYGFDPEPEEKTEPNASAGPNAVSDSDDEGRRVRNNKEDNFSKEAATAEGKPEEDLVVGAMEDPQPMPTTRPKAPLHTSSNADLSQNMHYFPQSATDFVASSSAIAPHFIPTDHLSNPGLGTTAFSGGTVLSASFLPATSEHDGRPDLPQIPQENAGHMAEMFASRAFGSVSTLSGPFPKRDPPLIPPPHVSAPHDLGLDLSRNSAGNSPIKPAPIGWGAAYQPTPSQPMYGPPQRLAPPAHGPLDLEPVLASKIRRGRELGMLAVQQEEQGNMGAAEAGYIKALSLLIPASKELDLGPEFNRHVRMKQKGKVQREAAAMLDRCEEIRLFLTANGPSVPTEMPKLPGKGVSDGELGPISQKNKSPRNDTTNGSNIDQSQLPPSPLPPSFSEDLLVSRLEGRKIVLPSVGKESLDASGIEEASQVDRPSAQRPINKFPTQGGSLPHSRSSITRNLPPSPPSLQPQRNVGRNPPHQSSTCSISQESTPSFVLDISGRFSPPPLTPLPPSLHAAREVNVAATSQKAVQQNLINNGTTNTNLSQSRSLNSTSEKCFLCRAIADLKTKCDHTYCSNCGNQIVSVFGHCPVPECNKLLAVEDFEHVLP